MTWFEELTGVAERSGESVRSLLRMNGTRLSSSVNGREFEVGRFTTPSLEDLRAMTRPMISPGAGRHLRIREQVGDVRVLHQDPDNEQAVFQVASQFNCLEMAAPHMTPELGVGIYENDRTQGPACSIACGAGTIYRNYFAPVNGSTGQAKDRQVDCLRQMGQFFGANCWEMQNGYCFPTEVGLDQIERQLSCCSDEERDEIRGKLMVGLQSQTQVTLGDAEHLVTQVFCSGLPIAYSRIPDSKWDWFPRLILEAAYEATFHVAVQHLTATGAGRLYLTLVGGGVFGNRLEWILQAITRSCRLFDWAALDVRVVSYGSANPEIARWLEKRG